MLQLQRLIDHIVKRVNINLRDPVVDVGPYVRDIVPMDSHALYYAFYALTAHHPPRFRFHNSSLGGSYFLGRCEVESSVLYKTDVRGDELKSQGDVVRVGDADVLLREDEIIRVRNSFLVKTLVHNSSHDPENLESFTVLNTVALHYANIHGSPLEGCYIGPFATVDLCTAHNCAVGRYAYVQAGDLSNKRIAPGRIWIRAQGLFEFNYAYDPDVLDRYIGRDENGQPCGEFMDFMEQRKEDFVPIYSTVQPEKPVDAPETAHVSPYAVIKGDCTVSENVLVAQRAYIRDSHLGPGANAQEHCYILNSTYEGSNITAHGGKVIHCTVGSHTFVGFNSFLRGSQEAPVRIGNGSVIMPHTIIDATEPIEIPADHLVWGYVRTQADLETHSLSLEQMAEAKSLRLGNMSFEGVGAQFVDVFAKRIHHILEENGAFYDGSEATLGHAQKTQNVSFNLIQPYQDGELKGMCPTMSIAPLEPWDR